MHFPWPLFYFPIFQSSWNIGSQWGYFDVEQVNLGREPGIHYLLGKLLFILSSLVPFTP